jgi:hypothetical protein
MKIMMIFLSYFFINFFIVTVNCKCAYKIDCKNNGNFNDEKCSCDCLTNFIGNDCSIGK